MLRKLVAQTPVRTPTLAWATVLHDVGKPVVALKNDGKNFNGQELEGARLVRAIGERFKLSRSEIDQVAALIENHLKFREVFKMRESTLQRWVREPFFPELLELHKADAASSDGNLAAYEFCASRLEDYTRQ